MKIRSVMAVVVLVVGLGTDSGCKSASKSSGSSPPKSSQSSPSNPSVSSARSSSESPTPTQVYGLGSGTLIVGKDIQPGTYKSIATDLLGGYWEREKDASGSVDSILANDNVEQDQQAVVTVAATDYAFKSTGFNGWVPASGPSLTGGKLGPGTLIVGKDIQPGTYKATATGTLGGYWERMKDTLGGVNTIIANDNVSSGEQAVVTISSSDAAFKSTGFGDWVKIG